MQNLEYRIWHEETQEFHYVKLQEYLGQTGLIDNWEGHSTGIWEIKIDFKDLNDKNVYPGDIVLLECGEELNKDFGNKNIDFTKPFVVVMKDYCWQLQHSQHKHVYEFLSDYKNGLVNKIGDIHQNPDLLEVVE